MWEKPSRGKDPARLDQGPSRWQGLARLDGPGVRDKAVHSGRRCAADPAVALEEAPAVRLTRRLTALAAASTLVSAGLTGCDSGEGSGDVTEVVIGADLASSSPTDTAY